MALTRTSPMFRLAGAEVSQTREQDSGPIRWSRAPGSCGTDFRKLRWQRRAAAGLRRRRIERRLIPDVIAVAGTDLRGPDRRRSPLEYEGAHTKRGARGHLVARGLVGGWACCRRSRLPA